VSTNVFTPFTYAQNNSGSVVENLGEYEEIAPVVDEVVDERENLSRENEMFEDSQIPTSWGILHNDGDGELLDNNVLSQAENLNVMKSNNPIQVLREWEVVSTYVWLSQAINWAESGDVINILDDISVTEASVVSWKSLTINGNNHIITREADVTTLTVNEGSSLKLIDITITDNAVNFAPNRYNSLLTAKSNIPLCLWWVNETRNESWDVIASACATENVDTTKTNPQIYSVWDIYWDNLTISNSLNSKWSAAIIVEKWWIEMINSNFIHNWASGWWRGWAIRVWPNSVTNIVDESPITKILFSWCLFENNYSSAYWWALAFHYAPETITIDNCIFSGNTASANWWAIQILNIWYKLGWSNASFWISTWSNFPIGTMYVNSSEFYNNWCGNDGAAVENDDINLEINWCYFEHNYWTQPLSTSVWVVSCQAGSDEGGWDKTGRWGIYREYKINNSKFKDTNTVVLWDHNAMWSYFVDNCIFEMQTKVILTYNWRWEIKNSTIKNSNPYNNCGITWSMIRDIDIVPYSDYLERINLFWESIFKLENNTYSNDCTTNEYFQVRDINLTTWVNNIIIENEDNTKIFVHRSYYDSANIQWTDEIYYWATIDDWKFAYIKKNKFYNFEEFNDELNNFSYSNSGYQLQSWKTMLFYIDSGYTELWSGSISTTTNLYWKETDIHNITYEWMEWADFEWITHTYKFNNLNHTQYLTELTPYALNNPSKNWYKFEWRFFDTWYTIAMTGIEAWSTWDITLYAKWVKEEKTSWNWYSGWWGWWWGSDKSDISKEEKKSVDTQKEGTQNGNKEVQDSPVESEDTDNMQNTIIKPQQWQNETQKGQLYSTELQEAYIFAKENWITSKDTILEAKMSWKLTRIQMAKMLSNYAINVLWKQPDISRWAITFKDVTDKVDKQYDNWVTLAYQLWIMWQNMPNNKFRPNDEVTRAEFAAALSRMLYNTSDWEYKSTSKYYTPHMAKLYNEWIINNTDPKMKERRWYVMIMLMRSVK